MLYQYEEYSRVAEFTGFRGVAFDKIDAYLKSHRKLKSVVGLQFFDADLIATEEHLYFAVLNALQSFKSKTNCSKSVAMESMLYASAQRQINKAIQHIGVKPTSCNLAVAVVADNEKQVETQLKALTEYFGCAPDASVLQLTEQKIQKTKAAFQVTEQELKTQKKEAPKSACGPHNRANGAALNAVLEHLLLNNSQNVARLNHRNPG